jgi:intracellular sulfur oxidation DsrE/DsrF family protein
MNTNDQVSMEQLNAFLDNELEQDDRAHVLAALRDNKSHSDELAQLQQVNALISLAYQDVPTSPHKPVIMQTGLHTPLRIAAAFAILLLGGIIGWFFHHPNETPSNLPFTNLSQLNVRNPPDNKILIHINAMDDKRITRVLNDTEQLLTNAKQSGNPLQLEIVANASGLGMLRQGSPYTKRIEQIAAANSNVAFLACGFAMENAKLKEGHNIKLIPEAHKVDAALEQILRRLKAGWLYVRG